MINRTVNRIQSLRRQYPHQYWLLFWGMLISTLGMSMIWPFLVLYLRQQLDISLTAATMLLAVGSVASLAASFISGPIADRLGRRLVMMVGLIGAGLTYVSFIFAGSLGSYIVLMVFYGLFRPMFRVGADAMIADIIPVDQRADAYSLMRIINNAGVAIGPTLGGFAILISYDISFFISAACLIIYGLMVILLMKETLPQRQEGGQKKEKKDNGYREIFKDGVFIWMIVFLFLGTMGAMLMFVLMPVYGNEVYGLPESRIGFIMAANAVVVVLFQYRMTQMTKKYPPLIVMGVGALFYAVGLSSVILGKGFWGFLLSMIIMSVGELIWIPTASALTADLASVDNRGKYMSIFGLIWGFSSGFGSVMGGVISDVIEPVAIWYAGGLFGLIAALGNFWLRKRYSKEIDMRREMAQ